ncbi:MAG: endo-1,4-beta-xylanase [Bacteroidales bacterium]|nr:endo-1,4-beta-xylanase [Bacteroidales bacterium]
MHAEGIAAWHPKKFNMGHWKTLLLSACLLFISLIAFPQDDLVIVEAESGETGSDYQIRTTDGLQYVDIQSDYINLDNPGSADRVITYEVTFSDTGSYDLYARLRAGPDAYDDDSFFHGNGFGSKDPANDEDWIVVNNLHNSGFVEDGQVVTGNGGAGNQIWKWINISGFTGGELPVSFKVEPGNLTRIFMLGGREDGLALDKFAFGLSELYYTVSDLDNGESGSEEPPAEDDEEPIAEGQSQFLGNIYSPAQLPDFTNYWNQVTPENEGKWGSVERSRDEMNWSGLDAAYDLAKNNGFPFRMHVMIWGNQQPEWIEDLDSAQQREEIEEWFSLVAGRYPDIDYLEVVNEPIHDPPQGEGNGDYIKALGGEGETGWDWVVQAFELARQYFPDSVVLMINDYNIVNSSDNTKKFKEIIDLLMDRNLIDAVGVQAHAFSTRISSSAISGNIDRLAEKGLPIIATELDIDGPTDAVQLQDYQRIFPLFWGHQSVEGVTLWGFRPGLWRNEEKAYLVTPTGKERPALLWLRAYVNGNYIPMGSISVSTASGKDSINTKEGTLQMEAEVRPEDATIKDVIWNVSDTDIATIDSDGILTAKSNGTVTLSASSIEYQSDVKGLMEITVTNQGTALCKEKSGDEITVFPNPSLNGNFTIQGTGGVTQVNILNSLGNLVRSFHLENQSLLRVNLNVSPGIYFIQLVKRGKFMIEKIMILG